MTASANIAASSGTTIAVNKGQTAYYTTTVAADQDDDHMAILTHDAGHLAAANVQITVAKGTGWISVPDGTYYLHVSVGSIGRLNTAVEAGTSSKFDDYVDG